MSLAKQLLEGAVCSFIQTKSHNTLQFIFTQIYIRTTLDSDQEIQSRASAIHLLYEYVQKLILHVISFIAQLRYKESVFKVIFRRRNLLHQAGEMNPLSLEKHS